jgi:hypothetical protein
MKTATTTATEPRTAIAKGKALGPGTSHRTAQSQHQEVEQVVPTQSGRIPVKRVIFEARKN